jgi:hydroxyacylglutathione hydrolase
MKIEQIYTGCLAQGAYYIVSNGEAAVIDPLREVKPYIDRAERDGVKIKYVLETHFHADFVSGHIDLAKATGAEIIYGPQANPSFKAHIATDGERLKLGKISLEVLHTPGHTMESTCYLLRDENEKPHAVFTGDTLFIGDVGRPDLAQKAEEITQEQLAATLYQSLRSKLITLPDEVIVYPAHGAGSACGKNMSSETVSTIGEQKKNNYALRSTMSSEEFVKEVTDGLAPPPAYFPMNVALNKQGYSSINDVMKRGMHAMSPDEFELASNSSDALMLDTRTAGEFAKGFIPNSINIGLNGQFAPWVGALIPDVKQQLLIITEKGKEEETVMRLARVGYDYVIGFLEGGFQFWKNAGKEYDTVNRISAAEFEKHYKKENPLVIDIRRASEFDALHVKDAINLPLDYINEQLASYPKDKTFYMHCASGFRSMIAASILKSRGWNNFVEVGGGFNAIKHTEVPAMSGQMTD